MAKKKLTFKIVENYKDDVDIEEMAKDYANPEVTLDELCEKYDISRKKYYQFKEELVRITGFESKPTLWGGRGGDNFKHIYRHKDKYRIAKSLNKQTVHFGQYDSLDEAVLVRDELIDNNWSIDYFFDVIKKRYACKDDAWMNIYDEFKEDYVKGMSVDNLIKKYGLTKYRYYSLSASLRHELKLPRKPRILTK